MKFARPLTILSTAALAASLTVSTAGQALSAGTDLSLQQRPLVMAAEQVLASAGGRPGYAGITLADKEVMLWWKGDVPADVTSAVKSASKQAPVRVAAAAHSQAELTVAAKKLETWRKANPSAGIYGVKNPGDGSGLVLAAKPGVATAMSALDTVADVPLRVLHEEPLTPVSRGDDAPPWKGGARTWNQTASTICTAGFGVRNGAGNQFVLTAEHCGQTGHRIADGVGEFIGNVGRGTTTTTSR